MKLFSSSSESNFLFAVMDSSVQTKVINFEVVEKLSSPFEVTTFFGK